MNLEPMSGRRSVSPASSGRSSPVPRTEHRRAVEDELFRADKGFRRYGTLVERAVASWEISPHEWADYIAFLNRLLKAIQAHPKDVPTLPHTNAVASKLAQCLNPALPSGVHQRALEVYDYIFSSFGSEYVANHLPDYLPGLAPVLAFASLSIRPGVYNLFEDYILDAPIEELRPALKSMVLSVLPALEDETSEDFDRAALILQRLERRFSQGAATDSSGLFWQSLFLCTMTSASRRLGALNYLFRRLPRFVLNANTTSDVSSPPVSRATADLPDDLMAMISPEPGLLIRCFAAGLTDVQALVQRGFLDLLVTHLPLHSPVLSSIVDEKDVDLLMTATMSVLLRRDMGLNRRVWSWLLGSDVKDARDGQLSPSTTKDIANSTQSNQITYFEEHARPSIRRTILAMLSSTSHDPLERARPYRICLSLMDTWEIGGSFLSDIFLPSLQHLYDYSLVADPAASAEVMKSASQFFDSVEAAMIWSTIIGILQDALEHDNQGSLALLSWILNHFDVQDQEMRQVHAPLATLYLVDKLAGQADGNTGSGVLGLALGVIEQLVALIPSSIFTRTSRRPQISGTTAEGARDFDVPRLISEIYSDASKKTGRSRLPIDACSLGICTLRKLTDLSIICLRASATGAIRQSVELLMNLRRKLENGDQTIPLQIYRALEEYLQLNDHEKHPAPVPVLSSAISLLDGTESAMKKSTPEILQLISPLTTHLWSHLSPRRPKYHVEAVKCLWQLESAATPSDAFEVALLQLLGSACSNLVNTKSRAVADLEAVERFMVLWSHTLPSRLAATVAMSGRRSSAMSTVLDSSQSARRVELLADPLFSILNMLQDPASECSELVTSWLGSLPSLDSVLACVLDRYWPLCDEAKQTSLRKRPDHERIRELEYVCSLLQYLFASATTWTWQCLNSMQPSTDDPASNGGVVILLRSLLNLLSSTSSMEVDLRSRAMTIVDLIVTKSDCAEIFQIDLEGILLGRMIECVQQKESRSQASLLRLTTKAILGRLHLSHIADVNQDRRRPSLHGRTLAAREKKLGNVPNGEAHDRDVPPRRLLECLLLAFTSMSTRPRMELWVNFVSDVLPVFAGTIFTSLIPLVETICKQLQKVFSELLDLSSAHGSVHSSHPDSTLLCLLDALELILAKAHEQLLADDLEDEQSKPAGYSASLLSGKPSQANSRLTVILAFHDAIYACFNIWTWSNRFSAGDDYDKSAAATTVYYASKLRNKTRYLLEQMFVVEPLESLEALLHQWVSDEPSYLAGNIATITLLQAMQSTRPKHVLPIIIDALCSRISGATNQGARQSSLTIELLPAEVALFLHIYLQSIEDDAMDEVWNTCVSFLRDVLTNPLPYRTIMPVLLSLAHVLAKKAHNTNFGEQRKMRKELADIFQKLLAATFSTLPGGSSSLGRSEQTRTQNHSGQLDMTLAPVLSRVVADLDVLVDNPDRATAVVNSISNNLLAPGIHAKTFPTSVESRDLELLLTIATSQPSAKGWKKDIADAVNDTRLFASSAALVYTSWFPVLHQWTLRDRERMPEMLARLAAPSSAGIMFGVGANAARLDADRKAQFNSRRICLLLLCSPLDTWVAHLRDFDEKIVELFSATSSSSPSSAIKADLYILCRALTLSFSPAQLSPLWPNINDNLRAGLLAAAPSSHSSQALPNLGLLQACKLLDQLITLSPDDFQLHEWLYITDTVDAVNQPLDQSPVALADQIVEALGTDSIDWNQTQPPSTVNMRGNAGRRPLLIDSIVDHEDAKAMSREEFAKSAVRPFLSQLSIHAYESVYRSSVASAEDSRQALLQDLLDTGTIVD